MKKIKQHGWWMFVINACRWRGYAMGFRGNQPFGHAKINHFLGGDLL